MPMEQSYPQALITIQLRLLSRRLTLQKESKNLEIGLRLSDRRNGVLNATFD